MFPPDIIRKYFEETDLGFVVVRMSDWSILQANHSFAKILGYVNIEDIIGIHLANEEYTQEDNLDKLKATLMIHDFVKKAQIVFIDRKGTKIKTETAAFCDDSRENAYLVISDISHIENLKIEKSYVSIKFHTVLDLIQNAYLLIRNGCIEDCNQVFLRMFGFNQSAINRGNVKLIDIIPLSSLPIINDCFSNLNVKNRHSGKLRLVCKKSDDTDFQAEAEFILLSDEKGDFIHGIIRDHHNVNLLEEKLLQAQKMEAVGRLASGIAHDFNNLLTAIIGHTDLAIISAETGRNPLQDLEVIQQAANKLSDLSRQLLAFSRKQKVEPKVIVLNTLVSNIDKMLRRIIGEDINFITIFEKDLKRIEADPGQLEQVLVNIVVNARDAMPRGGKLIIETSNVTIDDFLEGVQKKIPPGVYVRFTIQDTGSGMTPEIISKAFEPFFTTKGAGKGTGLGLATVKDIMDQNKGYIRLNSVLGEGTTFEFYFPMVEKDAEELSFERVKVELPTGAESILIVEDENSVLEFTSRLLKKLGYKVTEAHNGREALIKCVQENNKFDLILTDLIMPDVSGVELFMNLQKNHYNSKIVYMSGYRPESFITEILKEDTPYIQKPFHPLTLARKIRETLDS